MRFLAVFRSRGDVPKAMFRIFFFINLVLCLFVCPPGGVVLFFLSLSYERLHREKERERIGKRNDLLFFLFRAHSFSSPVASLSFREFCAETHRWIYPHTVWACFILPLKFLSLSLFFLFLLTHFSFSLNNNNNRNQRD